MRILLIQDAGWIDMRKIWILYALAIAAIGFTAAYVNDRLRPARGIGINRLAFLKIRLGMTEDEIAAILGAQAGDYSKRPIIAKGRFDAISESAVLHEAERFCGAVSNAMLYLDENSIIGKGSGKTAVWISDQALVIVSFDSDGKAAVLLFSDVVLDPSHKSWFERLIAFFG